MDKESKSLVVGRGHVDEMGSSEASTAGVGVRATAKTVRMTWGGLRVYWRATWSNANESIKKECAYPRYGEVS